MSIFYSLNENKLAYGVLPRQKEHFAIEMNKKMICSNRLILFSVKKPIYLIPMNVKIIN